MQGGTSLRTPSGEERYAKHHNQSTKKGGRGTVLAFDGPNVEQGTLAFCSRRCSRRACLPREKAQEGLPQTRGFKRGEGGKSCEDESQGGTQKKEAQSSCKKRNPPGPLTAKGEGVEGPEKKWDVAGVKGGWGKKRILTEIEGNCKRKESREGSSC